MAEIQENYLTLCCFLGLLSKEIWDFFGCFGLEEAQLGEAVTLINFDFLLSRPHNLTTGSGLTFKA